MRMAELPSKPNNNHMQALSMASHLMADRQVTAALDTVDLLKVTRLTQHSRQHMAGKVMQVISRPMEATSSNTVPPRHMAGTSSSNTVNQLLSSSRPSRATPLPNRLLTTQAT